MSSVLLVKKENLLTQMNADLGYFAFICGSICTDHLANAALLLLRDLRGRLLRVAPVVENADLVNAL